MTEQVRLEADTIGGEVRVKAKTTGGPGRVRLPLAGPRNGQPNRLALPAGLLALFTLVPVLHPPVDAQLPVATDDRYAGLQWRFVRIRYHYTTEGTTSQASRGTSMRRPPSRTSRVA